jgi:hypothetical protein
MKYAIDYRDQFLRAKSRGKDLSATAFIIAKEMIEEAVMTMQKEKPDTAEKVAAIFQLEVMKWRDLCFLLYKFPMQKEGLLALLKRKEPKLYFILIANGLDRLKEDEPTVELESKGDEDGTPA